MVWCEAFPVKKPVPANQLVPTGPCACEGFRECQVFREAEGQGRQPAGAPLEESRVGGRR